MNTPIKIYERLPETVEVIQWDGKQDTFNFLRELVPNVAPFYVNCVRIPTGPHFQVAEVDDFIILSKPIKVMKLDEFKNTYVGAV
jgi:hypothetical protein